MVVGRTHMYQIKIFYFNFFFNFKAFSSKLITFFLWIGTSINFYNELPSPVLKYLFCVFPNLALNFGFEVMFQYERSGRATDASTSLYNQDMLTLSSVMFIMAFWTLVYLPVTWYVENISPGQYGTPLPFYFPFMVSCLLFYLI